MKKGFIIFGVCLAVIVIALLIGFGNSNSIYGTYILFSETTSAGESSQDLIDSQNRLGLKLVVNSDNTASYYVLQGEPPLQFTFDENYFTTTLEGKTESIPYTFENGKITWTSDGSVTVFKKK